MGKPRYRTTLVDFWELDPRRETGFEARGVYHSLLTHSRMGTAGAFRESRAGLAAELGLPHSDFHRIMSELTEADLIAYQDGWIAIRGWAMSQGQSPDFRQGVLDELCVRGAPAWVREAVGLFTVPNTLPDTLPTTGNGTLPDTLPQTREQDQEGEQEREPERERERDTDTGECERASAPPEASGCPFPALPIIVTAADAKKLTKKERQEAYAAFDELIKALLEDSLPPNCERALHAFKLVGGVDRLKLCQVKPRELTFFRSEFAKIY